MVSVVAAVLVSGGSSGLDLAVNNVIVPVGFAVLPVCVGVAVLKDAANLGSVREDLAAVVQEALEPAHISVWMNERGETG